jgi:hypothetical protein
VSDFVDNIIDNNATITASANSAAFIRPASLDGVRHAVLDVNIGANPTGTAPTLTYTLQASLDGTTWYDAATTGALNAQGTKRLEAKGIEPQWRVAKTIGGSASPTFTQVTSHLLFA